MKNFAGIKFCRRSTKPQNPRTLVPLKCFTVLVDFGQIRKKIVPTKINSLKVLSITFLLLGQITHQVYFEHTFVFCSSFSSGQQMPKLLLWKLLTPLLLQLQRLKLLMMFQIPIIVHHTLSLISAHVFVVHLQHSFAFLQPLYTSFYCLS